MVQAEYRATGWLGAFLGSKLYIDFSRPGQFDTAMLGLLKELEARDVLAVGRNPEEPRRTILEVGTLSQGLACACWTITDVQTWLSVNELAAFQKKFEQSAIDGVALAELVRLARQGNTLFGKVFQDELFAEVALGLRLRLSYCLQTLQ